MHKVLNVSYSTLHYAHWCLLLSYICSFLSLFVASQKKLLQIFDKIFSCLYFWRFLPPGWLIFKWFHLLIWASVLSVFLVIVNQRVACIYVRFSFSRSRENLSLSICFIFDQFWGKTFGKKIKWKITCSW